MVHPFSNFRDDIVHWRANCFRKPMPKLPWWQTMLCLLLLLIGQVPAVARMPIADGIGSTLNAKVSPNVRGHCVQCLDPVNIPESHIDIPAKRAVDNQPDNRNFVPPAHSVDIAPFSIAKFDVTKRQFKQFVAETEWKTPGGCYVWREANWVLDRTKSWRDPGFPQTDDDPVVCVSWADTQGYLNWLNRDTNPARMRATHKAAFRLPTWDEAEYAAQGVDRKSVYSWGNGSPRDHANYGRESCLPCGPEKSGKDKWLYTTPVGSFPANSFGLYDAAGNVGQWTSECWPEYPSRPENMRCKNRVVTGGAWLSDPHSLRPSEYVSYDALNRNTATGFRVAQSLDQTEALAAAELHSEPITHPIGSTFKECAHCPSLTVLPVQVDSDMGLADEKGSGAASISQEIPRLAVGTFDVTVDEYGAFIKASHYVPHKGCQILDPGGQWIMDGHADWRQPGFRQTGRDPVVCVSWLDAQAYTRWLNAQIGAKNIDQHWVGPYRLLNKTEWEFAARGWSSAKTPYYWGYSPSHEFANYGVEQCIPCGGEKLNNDHWYFTSPVGSFTPNSFGLYDMEGNVWQWTDECSPGDLRDPQPHIGDVCTWRVLRGGSFDDVGTSLTILSPNAFQVGVRNFANGFRIARDLN